MKQLTKRNLELLVKTVSELELLEKVSQKRSFEESPGKGGEKWKWDWCFIFLCKKSDPPAIYPVEGISLVSNLPVRYPQIEKYSSVWVWCSRCGFVFSSNSVVWLEIGNFPWIWLFFRKIPGMNQRICLALKTRLLREIMEATFLWADSQLFTDFLWSNNIDLLKLIKPV